MQLRFDNVSKEFGETTAIRIPALVIEPGEFFSFVGPAGAGKSTVLGLIAGDNAPSAGTLTLGDRAVNGRESVARDVRVITPDAVLQPGGQPVSLFDDPLAGLESAGRASARERLKALHRELGTTFVYATDDQEEALALSDRIAVVHEGRVHQVGTPASVYDKPITTFVASFFGDPPMNVVPGILEKDGVNVFIGPRSVELNGVIAETYARDIFLGIRPEHVQLRTGSNGWKAKVSSVTPCKGGVAVAVTVDMGAFVAREEGDARHAVGDTVLLTLPPRHLHVFDDRGGRLDVL